MTKLKRNDKCHCNSGKKYKTCCLDNDSAEKSEHKVKMEKLYEDGHEMSSELKDVYKYFSKEYKKFKIIDVSNVLTSNSYRYIQTKHYFADTILLAKRTDENDQVFQTRGDATTDVMVMFRGAHQVFTMYSFENMKDQLKEMISVRLRGDDYTC